MRRGARVPGHIGAALQGRLDEKGRDLGRERIVAAQEFDPQRASLERGVDERFHLGLARCGVLERERRRGKLQDRHVDARAVLGHVVENVFQRPGHVQARGHAVHRKHPRPEGRAPHFAQVHVAVDDPGLQHQARQINRFLGRARAVALDGGDPAVFHGDVHHGIDAV